MSHTSIQHLPPMMQQYWKIKNIYKDYLLLFRVGDFFELFYSDAENASKELGLILTKRTYRQKEDKNKGNSKDETESMESIPMCGMPHHIYLQYCYKLVMLNYKIVVCDQMETPEEAKAAKRLVVDRQITKILTKSTIYYENETMDLDNHFLISIIEIGINQYNILICDIATSDYFFKDCNNLELESFIQKINPEEILISKYDDGKNNILELLKTWREKIIIWSTQENIVLNEHWQKYINTLNKKESYNVYTILSYLISHGVDMSQCNNIPQSFPFKEYIILDSKTIKNLHLLPESGTHIQNNQYYSLFQCLDKTYTPMGKRYLKNLILFPSTNLNTILDRQNKLNFFLNLLKNNLKFSLDGIGDIEKSLTQCMRKRITPIALVKMAKGLKRIMDLFNILKQNNYPQQLNYQCYSADLILNTMEEEEHISNGLLIKSSNVPILEKYRHEIYMIEEQLKILIEKYSSQYKINNIKIKNDSRVGYYMESPKSQESNIINSNFFKIVQYGLNYIRFSSDDFLQLVNNKEEILNNISSISQTIINQLIDKIIESFQEIQHIIREIAQIDTIYSLALVAHQHNYIKPIVNNSNDLYIKNGGHIIVENNCKNFVRNDINMDNEKNLHIITGPNMGGKSTFLRQNAIIVILAQIGAFVPAEQAIIGITDNIFTRIGADDNLMDGESTFKVEMEEIAYMLKSSTNKSLMIIDELGRGTSIKDGLAIAISVVENIAYQIHCRCIFSTHFHGIYDYIKAIPTIKFFHFGYLLQDNNIHFTYKIQDNICQESFGIYVMKLSGISESIINRAFEIMKEL